MLDIGLIVEGLKSKASWVVVVIVLVVLLAFAIILEKKDNTILKKDNEIVTTQLDQAVKTTEVVVKDQKDKEQVNAVAAQEKTETVNAFSEIKRQANQELAKALSSQQTQEPNVPADSVSSTTTPTPTAPVKEKVVYQPSPDQLARSQKVATIVIDTMWQSYCAAGGKCP